MEKLLNKRKSNFELLRIISMLFIVAAHYAFYNDFNGGVSLGIDFVFSCFRCGGKLGVTLLILTTGYFMVHSDIKIKKIIRLEFQVLFYTTGSFIFWILLGREFTPFQALQSFLPNLLVMYWFFTSYFALYLFIPFINKFVLGLKKKEFQKLLLLSFVFLILIPSVFIYNSAIMDGIYLVYYYMVGCYIKLYFKDNKNKYLYLLLFIISYLGIILLSMVMNHLSVRGIVPSDYVYFFTKNGSVFLFVSAISLFLFFKNIKITYSKVINKIASVSFGVYLLHENFFVKEILWQEIFVMSPYNGVWNYFLVGILSVFSVYIIGGIIDIIRQLIFKWVSFIVSVKKII